MSGIILHLLLQDIHKSRVSVYYASTKLTQYDFLYVAQELANTILYIYTNYSIRTYTQQGKQGHGNTTYKRTL